MTSLNSFDRQLVQYVLWMLVTSITAVSPNLAAAEAVVAIVKRQMVKGTSVPYLDKGGTDQGYIAISARLMPSSIDKAVCVTPTNPTGGSDNYFVKGNLEMNITAIVEGFELIDPVQQIPIATFNFKDSEDGGKYCMTPFSLPITLVPNHPFEKYAGVGAREPRITFKLSTTSQHEERVSKLVVGWLEIAGAVATGGAANTVVGLANIASGKAVTTLSKLYSERNKSIADLAVSVEAGDGLSWKNLASGVSAMRISLIESTPKSLGHFKGRESLKDALTRIKASPDASDNTALLDIELTFEYRRSLFVDDKELVQKAPGLYPKDNDDDRLRPYSVLNYPRTSGDPRGKDAPTLVQQINKLAPSLSSTISKNASACTQLLATLRGLGLNSLDRAIVIKAVLDDAKPNWNLDSAYYNTCLGTDADLPKQLSAMYDQGPGGFFAPTTVLEDMDQLSPQYPNDNLRLIPSDILTRVKAIHKAFSPGYHAHVKRQQIISAFFPASATTTSPFAWNGPPLQNALKAGEELTFDRQIDILATLAIEAASCIYVEANSPSTPHFFVLLEQPTDKGTAKRPHLVTMDFDVAPPHHLKSIVIEDSQSHLKYVRAVMEARSNPPAACKALLGS